jgi:hypothetical protein
MLKHLYVRYPLFLSDFNETWIFSTNLREKAEIPSFIKIRPVSAGLFHADGQTDGRTDMTKLIVAFREFAMAPNQRVGEDLHNQRSWTWLLFSASEQFSSTEHQPVRRTSTPNLRNFFNTTVSHFILICILALRDIPPYSTWAPGLLYIYRLDPPPILLLCTEL